MPIHVTSKNPRDLDKQFIEEYPKLALRETANSGAFWGDGDMRPEAVRYDKICFAVESKARFRGANATKSTPDLKEWTKAMTQLRNFAPNTTRLFLVYLATKKTFTISIPKRDAMQLVSHCPEIGEILERAELKTFVNDTNIEYFHMDEFLWDEMYKALVDYVL